MSHNQWDASTGIFQTAVPRSHDADGTLMKASRRHMDGPVSLQLRIVARMLAAHLQPRVPSSLLATANGKKSGCLKAGFCLHINTSDAICSWILGSR